MERKFKVVVMAVFLAMALGACGDVTDTTLAVEDAVEVEVTPEGDAPYATYCGAVTCPYFVSTSEDCYSLSSYSRTFRCQASACGPHTWTGCTAYNSTSCWYPGYALASPYCGNSTYIKCRYKCYRS